MKRNIDSKFSNWNGFDGIYEENAGEYVFISERKTGYFVTKFEFYRRYGLTVVRYLFPLTIFGSFKEIDNKITIEYKISYRIVFLYGAIVLFWLYLAIMSRELKAILVSIVGIFLTSLIVYIIYSFKKTIMTLMAEEIRKLLRIK